MNATVEVAPTATTNCECKEEWYSQCDFGHDGGPTHCGGHGNPGGGPPLKSGCCFNYWCAIKARSSAPVLSCSLFLSCGFLLEKHPLIE